MIDDRYHTDRDVGEYIEGLRGADQTRGFRSRSRAPVPKGRSAKNSALLDAIEDIEAQLQALSEQAAQTGDASFEDARTNAPRSSRNRPSNNREESTGEFGSSSAQSDMRAGKSLQEKRNYGSALERIEAQLKRVDQALEKKGANSATRSQSAQRTDEPARRSISDYDMAKPRNRVHFSATSSRPARSGSVPTDAVAARGEFRASGPQIDSTVRQMLDRSYALNEQVARTAETSVSDIKRTAEEALAASNQSQGTYRQALEKLAKLQSQDDSLNILREDVTSLRKLIVEANLSGASDHVLREIANLSGRIEQLSTAISETREDPAVLDTMRDVRALLDRSTLDPSIDAQFERILLKLDEMDGGRHEEDFAKLSEQMDHLRDILNAQPDMQHLTSISGQMNELIDRLAILEDDVRHARSNAAATGDQSGIEQRLANMQAMIERLDPSDRLMSLEGQLASLADRLEGNSDSSNLHKPLEALARQVESLVELTDRNNESSHLGLLETLSDRIANLDQFIRHEQAPAKNEHRFDQVEQTLARIDDMLAKKMGSADLGSLERSLSRLADRMEAQEDLLRSAPQAMGTPNSDLSSEAISQLESQIIDLAQRLDSASQMSDDRQFFEMLTERLDKLAEEFARTQTRFEAVDRMGADIRKLASNGAQGGGDATMLAEQAAIKALQQIGPLTGGSNDAALEAIIDGLKDDLHGLRRFAETSENATQQSLTGVSSMLNTIVDRLAKLEEQVRAEEQNPMAAAAPVLATEPDQDTPASRGLGSILRRRKAKSQPEGAQEASQNQPLSANELLQSRTRQQSRRASADGIASQPSSPARQPSVAPASTQAAAASSTSGPTAGASTDGRQPGIFLSGKAVSLSGSRPTANAATQTDAGAQPRPQVSGNVALNTETQPAPDAKPRTARIVQGVPGVQAPQGTQRVRSGASADQGQSKADFIAAARRAAQAAAQESAAVEKEQGQASGFLARFKGSKKGAAAEDQATAPQVEVASDTQPSTKGMSRKERRAAITEAARMAKQMKKDAENGQLDAAALEDSAAQLLEEEGSNSSLFAKLGHSFSRHSRPLLMAAAAILLAITTIQLVKNPNSSLYGLFNSDVQQTETTIEAPAMDSAPALEANEPAQPSAPAVTEPQSSVPGEQSSLTPSSGNVAPEMSEEDATRAIAFSQPTLAQDALDGPRMGNQSSASLSRQQAMAKAKALLSQPGNEGIDLTPTSAIPPQTGLALQESEISAQTASQPLPPITSSAAPDQGKANLTAGADGQTPIMQAANSGNTLAQFELGRRYTVGEGIDVNLTEAAKWFEAAANLNMPQAQYSLANLYEKGQGVKKDLQVARLWYQRAADQGNVKSMHNLAVLFAEGGLGQPDFNEAAQWFLKAADHGLKDSQYNLAILFARGMGVKQDLLQSYKWFAIAAQQGDKGAEAKRDEILAVLKGPQQKAAKALVAAWKPQVAKASANQIATLPPEWAATTPEQLSRANQRLASDQNVIAKAQSMLGALGYNAGPADGQMGPRTRMAIRNFQEIAGLKVTGEIDAALLEALAQRSI